MRGVSVLVLVTLIVLAGCTGIQNSPATSAPEETPTAASASGTPTPTVLATDTATSTTTTTPTASPTPTSSPTPEPPDNPWESRTVTVTFSDAADSDRDFSSSIEDAIEYWNGRTAQYTMYNVTFSYQPALDSGEADIVVVASRPITNCGGTPETDSFAGCYRHEHRFDVYVNQTDLQFRNTAIHEFGHALGLDHEDDPLWIMASRDTETPGQATNAHDRENPWNTTGTLNIAIGDSVENREEYRRAAEEVAEYYNTNDQYRPENLEVKVVDNWYQAHAIVHDASQTDRSVSEGASLGVTVGRSWDSDDDFETYTRAWVYTNDIDDPEWHIGSWTGELLGNDRDDLPSRYSN